jgi:hypothetical protein
VLTGLDGLRELGRRHDDIAIAIRNAVEERFDAAVCDRHAFSLPSFRT